MANEKRTMVRLGIGAKLLSAMLGLMIVAVGVLIFLSVDAINRAGQGAQAVSDTTLRGQTRDFMVEFALETAEKYDGILEAVRIDARNLAEYAAFLLENPQTLNMDQFWQADERMFVGEAGQYLNGPEDQSSVFVPAGITITEELQALLNQSAYLDLLFAPFFESDSNTVAIYIIGKEEYTRFYPNISLGEIVPPDFIATQDIFFQSGTPDNNPQREVVWTSVYDDPAGQGLLVSAVAPIYTSRGEFLGIIGIDVSLAELTASIEATSPLTDGYLFLLDADGRALALPGQGYQDILGRPPVVGETGVDLSGVAGGFAPVLAKMQQNLTDFSSVDVEDRELFVAYAPLTGTGWSLGLVTNAESMLQASTTIQTQLEALSRELIQQRVFLFGGITLLAMTLIGFWLTNLLVNPLRHLASAAQAIGRGEWDVTLPKAGQDEVGVLSNSLSSMSRQLQDAFRGLERRVDERTRDLNLAADVGRQISQLRDPGQMLQTAAELIRERFDLYYAQIYLVDTTGRSLVLRAGTGEVGETLLQRGHRLAVNLASINGTAVVEHRPVIVEDTELSTIHRPNPLLPRTRSEMAVPLIAGDQVVGVLDLQSFQPRALSLENLPAFEALAGQLAIAISNAELFESLEISRQQVESQTRFTTERGWRNYLDGIQRRERIAFTYAGGKIEPLSGPLAHDLNATTLVAPIEVGGVPVGSFQFEAGEQEWHEDDRILVETVSRQVAQQVENLRLLAQAEQYRQDAQEALRRMTRQAWEEQSLPEIGGFIYSDFEVKPLAEQAMHENRLAFDIKVRDEKIGEIGLMGLDNLSPEDQELVALVSVQLGAQLENLRLSGQTEQALAQTEQQAQRLAALNRLSEQLSRAENRADVLNISSRNMTQIVQADRTSITWLTEDGQFLEVFALQGEAGVIPTGAKLPIAGTAVGTVLTERRVVFDPDLSKGRYLENVQLSQQGLRSTMAVPLLVSDQVPGTLNFGSSRLNAFGMQERDLAIQAASLIAGAIENQELLQQTRSALSQTEALFRIGANLNQADTEEEILAAVGSVAQAAGCKQTSLMYIDSDESGKPAWMTMVAGWMRAGEAVAPLGMRFDLSQFPFATALMSSPDHAQLIGDVANTNQVDDALKALWLQGGSLAMVIVPLVQGGRWLGLITFSWDQTHEFSELEETVYTALISLATPAVASRRLFAQAQTRAQQEQTLRQITSAVRGSSDPITIMRTAVRELGQALGRKTFIRLDKPEKTENGNGKHSDAPTG